MVEVREILARPTVDMVIAELRFPHLLAIERKMPDIQLALIDRFPELRVQFQYNVLIGDPRQLANPENLPEEVRQRAGEPNKFWEFDSKVGDVLKIATNSISLTSKSYKSYNRGDGKKFRDFIEFASSRILSAVPIPYFERVGLRYVDVCPFEKDNAAFRRWYNVPFPIEERFALPSVEEMYLASRVKIGGVHLLHQAAIRNVGNQLKLVLDYDAYAIEVPTARLLPTLDQLHEVVIAEYGKDITPEFLEYMRRPG